MAEKQLKESQIHTIVKILSFKREVTSPKRGHRVIPRSISPEALTYITFYLNNHLKVILEACELSLEEINNNPNSYYKQHRYDLQVVKMAIKMLENDKLYE